MAPDAASIPPSAPPSTTLRWTSHPLREEPLARSALLVGFIVALSVAVGVSFQHRIYGLLTLGVLTGFMSRYFAPTRYECDASGLSIWHLGSSRRIPWTHIGRVVTLDDGLFLSPFARPSRLDRFRGHYVRFGQNREAVSAHVKERVAKAKE